MGEHNGFFSIDFNLNHNQAFVRIRQKAVLPSGPPYQTTIMSSE